MAKASRFAAQPDLLDWSAPEPSTRFADEMVRAPTLRGRYSRAISAALDGMDRTAVAQQMSDFLGERVSLAMLNGYASAARDDHAISMPRLAALLHVTGDRRLLQLLAEPLGWSVIDAKYEALIQIAAIQDQEDRLRREREALRREARAKGAL